MEYTFVFIEGCWYLKISTLKELMDYVKITNNHWEKVLSNLVNSKEFVQGGERHAGPVESSNGLYGSNNGNVIVVNKNGGYFMLDKDKQGVYSQWWKRDRIEFPEFKRKDIRIKKFPLGNHWYAYVGDMQIRDGDKIKWNSYEEAYEYVINTMRI